MGCSISSPYTDTGVWNAFYTARGGRRLQFSGASGKFVKIPGCQNSKKKCFSGVLENHS